LEVLVDVDLEQAAILKGGARNGKQFERSVSLKFGLTESGAGDHHKAEKAITSKSAMTQANVQRQGRVPAHR
jgi:hypothetical protein